LEDKEDSKINSERELTAGKIEAEPKAGGDAVNEETKEEGEPKEDGEPKEEDILDSDDDGPEE